MRAGLVFALVVLCLGPALAFEEFVPKQYLPVQDDAELGEAVLWQVISQGFGIDIKQVVDLHNTYDLYPEEIVMALTLARLAHEDVQYVCELRADRHQSWKGIAQTFNINPRHFYQTADWYEQGDPSEWYQVDIDIERDFMIPLLAQVYEVDDRQVWAWHRDGLGYSDLAVVLWLARKSGRDVDELLYLKQNRKWRWQTLAEHIGVDLTPIYKIRALHYHNPNFEPYYPDDHRVYHPYRNRRDHFDRREYHHYDVWIIYADGYCHHDYWFDYDPFFWFGRCSYTYYYPPGFDWCSEWRWSYYNWPRYHYVWRPARSYRGPFHGPFPPETPDRVERDGRRYGEVLASRLRHSRTLPTSVRYSPGTTVTGSAPRLAGESSRGAPPARSSSGARKGGRSSGSYDSDWFSSGSSSSTRSGSSIGTSSRRGSSSTSSSGRSSGSSRSGSSGRTGGARKGGRR